LFNTDFLRFSFAEAFVKQQTPMGIALGMVSAKVPARSALTKRPLVLRRQTSRKQSGRCVAQLFTRGFGHLEQRSCQFVEWV